MSRALYPGSFDPFTVGHLSILKKAVKLFDEVVIVISQNPAKKSRFTFDSRLTAICMMLELEFTEPERNKIKVVPYKTLSSVPATLARAYNCQYIIRGIRNNVDYQYEEALAEFNSEVAPDIETVYFRADNSVISSSMVMALINDGRPVDKYLPYDISVLERE